MWQIKNLESLSAGLCIPLRPVKIAGELKMFTSALGHLSRGSTLVYDFAGSESWCISDRIISFPLFIWYIDNIYATKIIRYDNII